MHLHNMTEKNEVRIYPSFSVSDLISESNYSSKLISGLGKPTKRGIKKCYSCGEYNGNRSTVCKNKNCGVVLKDSEEKSKLSLDAVKLLTGTGRQVYSVRIRDMGPDYRGFVQLPLLQLHNEVNVHFLSKMALCFVNSCQNSFDNSILKCHEEEQNESNIFCVHINSALRSQSTASAMELKFDILTSLKITEDVKQTLRLLVIEREGPLVQRISKSVMAVKCQVSPKHPLGYLHFTFLRARGKDVYEKYYCSCTEFSVSDNFNEKFSNIKNNCIHYYACLWALASDVKYRNEFSFFLSSESAPDRNIVPNVISNAKNSDMSILNKRKSVKNSVANNDSLSSHKRRRKQLKKMWRRVNIKHCRKLMPKVLPVEIKVLNEPVTDNCVSWRFIDWLGYVTETINMTMRFENYGILNHLVFDIPENFFTSFKNRIPNIYAEIQNGETFSYNVMNILHLKEIFETPKVKLIISKKFVHHDQKGYIEYDENEVITSSYQCSFIYFLNVGQSTVDESDNTNNSFLIEWFPITTSLSKVGQLKLQYKYGRKST